MSTSPSWFDQEKFSRLVKKVGPKPAHEAVPGQPGTDADNRSFANEGLASTARISLVSKPPSLLSEHRALPALPRRTAPLPTLKTLFPQPTPHRQLSTETSAGSEEGKEESGVSTDQTVPEVGDAPPFSQEGEALAEVWQKMGQLNEELAHAIQERDQALHDCEILREQLDQAEAGTKGTEGASVSTEELTRVTEERDQARKEYAALRKEFETLKSEQSPKEESGRARKELEQQLEGFRQKLEERNREVAALKAGSGGAGGEGDDKLQQQVASLREQLAKSKEEASIAQRGLALSQKALHETRDTLREATEGTSLSRHNFDNLKNECATLAQQNTVLQAQNDQLTRELAATKSKLTTRL